MSWWNDLQGRAADNKSLLLMGGAGLLSGNTPQQGIANMAQMAMVGSQLDSRRSETAKRNEQRNKTMDYFRAKRPDLYAQVEAGMPVADAWKIMHQAKPERKTAKDAAGRLRYLDDGSYAFSDVQMPGPKPTSAMQEYEYGRENPDFLQHQMDMKKAGATKVNFNDAQSKAATFADRMFNSEQIIQKYEQAGADIIERAKANIPIVGNKFVSDEFQMFDQARRDFVNAILRRESGAVIGADEFANAERQYFPQPGDSPAVIAQKRKNREVAIQGIQRAAGPSYQPPQPPAPTDSALAPSDVDPELWQYMSDEEKQLWQK